MATSLQLSAALSDNVFNAPLIEGRVAPQGAQLAVSVLHGSEMFWRQLKFAEFDVSEMSISSLLIATARGDRTWVALPVFTMRRFFHTGILVRADAGIERPQDLVGKRVGVPEYQQTSAIWSRGVLKDQFGVTPEQIEWFMERGADRSHGELTGFRAPDGVRINQIPPTSDIGSMLLSGELDATLLYLNDKNIVDRSRADLDDEARIRRLFPDPVAEGRRYHSDTGLLPMNHLIVLRRSLAERHPWLVLNLFEAFGAAKALVRQAARADRAMHLDAGVITPDTARALDRDMMEYGLRSARRELDLIAHYVHDQGLCARRVEIEEILAESMLGT